MDISMDIHIHGNPDNMRPLYRTFELQLQTENIDNIIADDTGLENGFKNLG